MSGGRQLTWQWRATSTFNSTKVVECHFSRFQQTTDPRSWLRSTNLLRARTFWTPIT